MCNADITSEQKKSFTVHSKKGVLKESSFSQDVHDLCIEWFKKIGICNLSR